MLEVTGLTCFYGDITAVDGLSFTVGPLQGRHLRHNWPLAHVTSAILDVT